MFPMSALSVRRTIIAAASGAVLVMSGLCSAGPAYADDGCENLAWPNLLNWGQQRAICDGPIRADGSWERRRILWTPAHRVPLRTSCYGSSYISCTTTGGYWVDLTVAEDMSYPVTPDTVLPNEPGHLDGGAATPGFVA